MESLNSLPDVHPSNKSDHNNSQNTDSPNLLQSSVTNTEKYQPDTVQPSFSDKCDTEMDEKVTDDTPSVATALQYQPQVSTNKESLSDDSSIGSHKLESSNHQSNTSLPHALPNVTITDASTYTSEVSGK